MKFLWLPRLAQLILASGMVVATGLSAAELDVKIRDADSGDVLAGVGIELSASGLKEQSCPSDRTYCNFSCVPTPTKVEAAGFAQAEMATRSGRSPSLPGYASTDLAVSTSFWPSSSQRTNFAKDIASAKKARTESEFDRVLGFLGSHRDRALKLDSNLSVTALFLLAEAEARLCLDMGFSTCRSAGESFQLLREARQHSAELFDGSVASADRVNSLKAEMEARQKAASRYGEIEDLAKAWARACDAASRFVSLGQEFAQNPSAWLKHGVDQDRIVLDEAHARKICYLHAKLKTPPEPSLSVLLNEWKAVVQRGIWMQVEGAAELAKMLQEIQELEAAK